MTKKQRIRKNVKSLKQDISLEELMDRGPKTRVVTNLMPAKLVVIAPDTPWCCNPASETYWSM